MHCPVTIPNVSWVSLLSTCRIADCRAFWRVAATVRRVWRMLDRAEYKRRQAPPGVKITRRAFGRDRRYPIVNGFRK